MRRSQMPGGSGDFLDQEWLLSKLRSPLVIRLLVAFLVVIWLVSGFFVVGPGEQGLILTFGRLSSVTDSGLHYRLPMPFQSHFIVDVATVRSAEVGFRTDLGGARMVPEESLMLTGDENIVAVQLFVQYLVNDPAAFLFQVRDAEDVLKVSAEIALRSAVGQNTIDFTMTEGRVEAQNQVKSSLQSLLDYYNTGLLVTEARLLAVDPPTEVRDAFHDVVRAFEDRERLVQQAEGYAEQVIPAARGAAAEQVLSAEAYREQRVIRAQGDASRFLALLEEYSKAQEVLRERMYLESAERFLQHADIILVDTENSNVLPFLPLSNMSPADTGNASAVKAPQALEQSVGE